MNKLEYLILGLILHPFVTHAASPDANKVKAHSCLMVIAWMLCMATSIFIVRYIKFKSSVKLFRKDIWFIIHISLNVLTFLMSIVAFLVILAEKQWQWLQNDGTNSIAFVHSLTGMSAIGLTLIQIIIGFLLRPRPESSRRFMFNVVHRSIGLSACLLACRVQLSLNAWGVVFGWTITVILVSIFMENYEDIFNENRLIKRILFAVFVVIIFIFTVALVVLIGLANVI